MARTMFGKIWDRHVVLEEPQGQTLLYVDLHLVHEVTSPQAFSGLRSAGRIVRRPEATIATVDHIIPTTDRSLPITDKVAAAQVKALERNARTFGVTLHDRQSPRQGIVHVIGPEHGYTQPGMIIVCGDSHTATHGAFGSFAFGIGTSEVEHVLATQCIRQRRPKTMKLHVGGSLPSGVTPKDLILFIIGEIGVSGAAGHVIEYMGEGIRGLTMEGRMTVCNMSIEAGARAGMIAPDDITLAYLKGRRRVQGGGAFEAAIEQWQSLCSEPGATFDQSVTIDARRVSPMVTWGTTPGMVTSITEPVPDPTSIEDPDERDAAVRALDYMGIEPGTRMEDVGLDRVFIGSCTNGRIEDLREVAAVLDGKRVASNVAAMVVPGSAAVKRQAEDEGIAGVIESAGFEWREAGCSMCLGMNPDRLEPGERCASTSNRNFEGRQGVGGRTHLVSPPMAAAAAVAGHFVDVRDWTKPNGRNQA